MHNIYQKEKLRVEQVDYFTWEATKIATIDSNGAILIISVILKHVMSSMSESAIGAVFLNAKEAIFIHPKLEEIGNPHTPTPIHTDNTASTGVYIIFIYFYCACACLSYSN
jgi:hypothetical protein